MNDPRRNLDAETELEQLLAEGLSAPPDAVLTGVTPWRRAVNRLLWGLALCTVTFQFANLQTILPTLGMVLILLGLRPLRRENGFFGVWWWTHLVRLGGWSFLVLYQAAPGWQELLLSPFGTAYTAVNLTLLFLQFLCLWQGVRAVRSKAGFSPGAGSGLALLVWYAVLLALGLTDYQGWPGALLLLAVYAFLLRGLYRMSAELEEAGYVLQPAPIRISDRALSILLLGGLLAGVLAINWTASRLPMDWQPLDPDRHSQAEAIKAHLLDLSVPEEVLADLTAEDLLACEGAVRALCRTERCHLTLTYNDQTPAPMQATAVAVELPGGQYRIFHHFLWTDNVGFYGSEAIQLWPAYQDLDGWGPLGELTGQVLCDKNGVTYAAPFHSLETVTYSYSSIFWGQTTRADPYAVFSLPRDGERCRGYVAYGIQELEAGWIINSWCNYVHCLQPFQYPAMTAQEFRMTGSFFSNRFRVMQTALQLNLNRPDG